MIHLKRFLTGLAIFVLACLLGSILAFGIWFLVKLALSYPNVTVSCLLAVFISLMSYLIGWDYLDSH